MFKQCLGRIIAMLAVAFVTACSAQPPSPSAVAPTTSSTNSVQSATTAPRFTHPTEITTSAIAPTTSSTSSAQSATTAPRFTHPTEITNPFYPVSLTGKAIFLGTEAGKPSRNEVTLLPDTKTIAWDGQPIEARVVQFVDYTDGKLLEIAYDVFAQADDGNVYYLGEDVSNYKDGKLVDHEGSWQTGKDGAPPALIMPAHPQVGQVFNPENLPGVVFETDEIMSLTEKTTTPAGPTDKGMLVKETLMDGSIEHKVYAANFGIIEDRAKDERLVLVLFNRTDAKPGNIPEPLQTIEAQTEDIIDVVPDGNWKKVTTDVAAITGVWQEYRTQAAHDQVPQPFQEALTAALDRLQKVSAVKQSANTLQAANDLSAAIIDLFTVYHPALSSDVDWLDVLERQVMLDVAANDFSAAIDSLAKTNVVWARLKPIVLAHNGSNVATQFEKSLSTQQEALKTQNASAVTTEAENSLELVDALENLF